MACAPTTPLRALLCPHCRGPLPPRARLTTVVCGYCGAAVSPDREVVRAADDLAALKRLRDGGAVERPALVLRARSGFAHTLEDAW